jgi:hypothetical protein
VDVDAGGLEVALVLDHPRGEAAFERVAAAVAPVVGEACVRVVEVLHAGGEAVARGLDDDVVMRAEHGPGVDLPVELLLDAG